MPKQILTGGRMTANGPSYTYGDDPNQGQDPRAMGRDLYGAPQVAEGPTELNQDGMLSGNDGFRAMRGQLPRWQPGEFEEWKMGAMSGLGTQFGRNRQMEHKMGRIPGMLDALRNGNANVDRVMGGGVGPNPALLALIKGMR